MFPLNINFLDLLKNVGDFYVVVATSATGAIVALTIYENFTKLQDKTLKGLLLTKDGILFVLYTIIKSFIISTFIFLIFWILSALRLLPGTLNLLI